MDNIYEIIRSDLHFNKFEVEDLLFVEYTCPLEDEESGVWSQHDWIVHVLSGKKTWRTIDGKYTAAEGETIYIKKGAAVVDQFFEEDFCMIGIFITDDFIRNLLKEFNPRVNISDDSDNIDFTVAEIPQDIIISTYFHSMLSYFSGKSKPSDEVLVLKLKELLLNLIDGKIHPSFQPYFKSLIASENQLASIMEANFKYNLSLEEYAGLCNRSLSSFKRDFSRQFGMPPGKWLKNKRLEYSTTLLRNSDLTISQIIFDCGFEDLSHFSTAFKEKFGISPLQFRKETSVSS